MSFLRLAGTTALVALFALAGCGGGGSATGGDPLLGTGTPTDAGGGGGGATTSTPRMTLALSSNTVTAAAPAQATATLTTASGTPIAGQVVRFATSDGLGALSVASALTDANGRAVVNLAPATATTAGADVLTATYTAADAASVSASAGFQLTATNVAIASFVSSVGGTLSAYGQTQLSVNLSGTTSSAPVTVNLSSACVTKGLATLTPASATVSTGTAVFTYRDQGCGSTDAVDGLQASVVGTTATAALNLSLSAPEASSVAFVSATPGTIYLKGTGLVENSNVIFQVRDANGLGVPGVDVVLGLTTTAGDLLLDGELLRTAAGAARTLTRTTDADGRVTVRVNAGTVPTPVRVTAQYTKPDGAAISTVSSSLAVAVGLPSQANFSLSQNTRNIEAYNIDGTSNTYTIIASDRLGNPVPDGTAINFVTESGQVQAVGFSGSANGLSSTTVQFQSSSPRPADGRMTVLAYALGEESFLDANGNNVYDSGEDFQDLGDVFVDRLYNGSYNPADDQFISLSVAGSQACRNASSSLLGLDVSMPSRALSLAGAPIASCSGDWGRAYVRRAIPTILSTSAARPVFGSALPANASAAPGACSDGAISRILPVGFDYNTDDSPNVGTFYALGSVSLYNASKTGFIPFLVTDANPVALNPVAAGSTISATATNGLSVSVAGGSPVPSTLTPTAASINYTFDDTTDAGTITISVRSPGGLTTSFNQTVYKGAFPAGQVACP